MSKRTFQQEVLDYHRLPVPGKIRVVPSKSCLTQRDLSLAYTPGVAVPCLEIERDPELADLYTSRANLVAVITNGTAVLGLGDIGPLAGKPVMEGKGVLFKRFADIDVFDLEINEKDPYKLVEIIASLEPTFGGINLEDIKAPECFIVEDELRKRLKIPVLHDDQHGTAVIFTAALLNALHLQDKKIEEVVIVCNGAGAAGIACMKLAELLGARRENMMLVDRSGVIHTERSDLTGHKKEFASSRPARTLTEAMVGADVFVGLSSGNCVTPEMLLSMADRPIVFAMANPDPEIAYTLAKSSRDDLIMATGRSDHPNQINNVLGFPFLFRGALDVGATTFNEEMKVAAVRALAELAREEVPDVVNRAYGGTRLKFGPDYILPKPFDPRLIERVPAAVAQAAIATGVARKPFESVEGYARELAGRIDPSRLFIRWIIRKAQSNPIRLVLPEGENDTIIRAAVGMREQKVAVPVLIGDWSVIAERFAALELSADGIEILDPHHEDERFARLVEQWYEERKRHGALHDDALRALRHDTNLLGALLVREGFADGMLSGQTQHYPQVLRPVLSVLGHAEGGGRRNVYGMYLMVMEHGAYFMADCTVNTRMDASHLTDLAVLASDTAKSLGFEPRVAMISFSNFGSSDDPEALKVAEATRILHRDHPDLVVDGEMQADTALRRDILARYPFNKLPDAANVLVFPSMEAGNIAYKLLREIGGGQAIGPILLGLPQQVHVLQTDSTVDEIVNLAAIASARAADLPLAGR